MEVALSMAQWVVGKALAPVADGVLEAWESSRNLGLNIEALRTELLLVQATLETASRKEISGPAMEQLLQKLRDSAHSAEDLLDELDYFRIHDELHGSYAAADQHAKGVVHDLVLNARHTAKAVGKLACLPSCWSGASPADPGQEEASQKVNCCARPRAKHRARGNSSSAPNTNQADDKEVRGCMCKLGKLLPFSSSPHAHDDNSGKSILSVAPQRKHEEETMLGFNRVDISRRMKNIVEELQPVRKDVSGILQSCDRRSVPDIAKSRPITSGQSIEPKLYGRDHIMNTIIGDMTNGKYCGKDLTVLPIVGPGGIGKTTMIQHIYQNQEVRNYFEIVVWVCVSLNFNLNKLLQEIKDCIPKVEGEQGGKPEELIEQRIKSKRFLLVLDDIWKFNNEDDWKRLLQPLKRSQQKGSMILVTTRFPAIARVVGTTGHSIELEGLESKYFRELFHAFAFNDDQSRREDDLLLETGDKIMEKLKGSPLAAKTVGTLLRKDLSLRHWGRVLESKEWESQTGTNDIMPALKLSYDYLPFHQQQCFSYSALFPEDHKYSSTELINLWIGLDILQAGGRNQMLGDIGSSNLDDLVTHGFFREVETNGQQHYVMHDLLHDLALKVTSHECLTVHCSNVRSVEIHPSIRHVSIIIDDYDPVSLENFKNQLRKLKTRLKVKQLHTLMLFGEMDESFANIFGDLFREANALRVLRLVNMRSSVESVLHQFSALVHLQYLCLGIQYGKLMDLPLAISRFYHLKILDLARYECSGLPKDMSNLAKLHHFYTRSDELYSYISNVGKLELLEELKVFRVNKESEGFESKQLEHLTELRELGIYNLEKIHSKEEAAEAKLIEKKNLERLTLDWDSNRANTESDVEAVVLESLRPHRYLQKLCIRGHGGPSCPTWLGDELGVKGLQSIHLSGVSWEVFPSLGKMCDLREIRLEHIAKMKDFVMDQSFCRLIKLTLIDLGSLENWVTVGDARRLFPVLQVLVIQGCPKLLEFPFANHIVCPPEQDWNMDWFPKLQELKIDKCPEFFLIAPIPWTETLHQVDIHDVKLLEWLYYSVTSYRAELEIVGKDDLHSLDQVLSFSNLTKVEELTLEKCPPLELKQLLMLTSLKKLVVQSLNCLVGPVGGHGDIEWQHPIEHLVVLKLRGPSGKELTQLLTHLPRLSKLEIRDCETITQLAVGLGLQETTSAAAAGSEVEQEKEEDGLLLFPPHLSDSLRELIISDCPELVLVDPSTFLPLRDGHSNTKTETRRGGLQALWSLQKLDIRGCPMFLSACLSSSPSLHLFPSSLQSLDLWDLEGMGTLEPLSNLTSLTSLYLSGCGENLRCEGLGPLLTTGGQLSELTVCGSPRFFAGWDPNPRRVLQDEEGGKKQQLQLVPPPPSSSKLQELWTRDAAGFLAAPICSLLSSSLTKLTLYGTKEMERFSKEQEDALLLLASLQELEFRNFYKLQHLPAGLHKLTNLKKLEVDSCPAVRSLPKDGLPKSLQELYVSYCGNEELKQQCRGLVGTIPEISVDKYQ